MGEYPEGFDKADKKSSEEKELPFFSVKETKLYYCTGRLGDDETIASYLIQASMPS